MFPLSCHRGPCCPSLCTWRRQGDKLPSWGTSIECFKWASARSLQAQEHLLCWCAHLVFSSHWQRQSSLLSSLWWQLHVALRPLTYTLDMKAKGISFCWMWVSDLEKCGSGWWQCCRERLVCTGKGNGGTAPKSDQDLGICRVVR